MTAQINDKVFHKRISYSVAGISGFGLFDPQAYGIRTVSISTACWRGYFVEYVIEEGCLLLTQVTLGLSVADEVSAKKMEGPVLFKASPVRNEHRWGWVYSGLREPISFTGGLLLADGFIRELYVHMGFHPAWKYRTVREVLFERGRMIEDFDRSSQIKELRSRLSAQPLQPKLHDDRARIAEWVEQCFSRDYTQKRDS